jgi:Flp pilus assembly protein TadB
MMAKGTNKNKQNKKPAKRPSSQPPRNPIYMVAIGLLAAAWIVWRFEPSQGLGVALLIGGGIFLAWLVFVLAFARSQRQGNDD